MSQPDPPGSGGLTPLLSFQTAGEGPGWDQREILPPAAAGWAETSGLAGQQP